MMINTIKRAIEIINENGSTNQFAAARADAFCTNAAPDGASRVATASSMALKIPSSPAIADWRIVERYIQRQERYYVADRAEQARSVEEIVYSLTVYIDSTEDASRIGSCINETSTNKANSYSTNSSEKVNPSEAPKKSRGEATITIFPSFSLEDCVAKIRQAVLAASKSNNPWFRLPAPSPLYVQVPTSGFEALSPKDRLESVRSALYSVSKTSTLPFSTGPTVPMNSNTNEPMTVPSADFLAMPPKNGNSRINSLELFISKEQRRLLNSQGIDYLSTTWRGYSEFVVEADMPSSSSADNSADNPYSTVELFDDIEFSEPDPERLAQSIGDRLIQVGDRALARPMPRLSGIPLILRGKEAEEIFSWFFENSRTEAIYSKASPFRPGANVQGGNENIEAEHKGNGAIIEPLDLWAEPVISGLPASAAFDSDGFPLERTLVIENGILKTLIGSVRHADWLGVPRRGAFPLFSVSLGSMSLEEMHAFPYIEPVMFSDFRLDSMTGDFGAEVRLAYYFDGKNVIPVTGGSISGSMSTMRTTMRRTKETAMVSRSVCPIAVMLQGAIIAGARY